MQAAGVCPWTHSGFDDRAVWIALDFFAEKASRRPHFDRRRRVICHLVRFLPC